MYTCHVHAGSARRTTREAAEAARYEHRRNWHGELEPNTGDEIKEEEARLDCQLEPELASAGDPAPEASKQPEDNPSEPVALWQWIGFIIIVLLVLRFLAGP